MKATLNFFSCFFLLALLVFSSACKKDKKVVNTDTPYIQQGDGVIIGNEGAFLAGNSSVMYYRFGDATASSDLYAQANSNQPLGDVLQSLFLDGSRLYMVVNNSQKIKSVQLPSFANVGTIAGLPAPRYMTKVDNDVAFVSNYGVNTLSRISLSQQIITGSITLPGWCDAVLYMNGKLYATAPEKNKLYICDPSSLQVTDSIAVGIGGNALVVDKNNMLWVFAAGEYWNNINGALVKINPATNQVVTNFDLGLTQGAAGRLCSNAVGDTLYYLDGDVYRMNIDDAGLQQAFITANGRSLYGLYRHPTKPYLFVTDAKDFTQNGDVYEYSPNGMLQKSFQAGIAPSSIIAY